MSEVICRGCGEPLGEAKAEAGRCGKCVRARAASIARGGRCICGSLRYEEAEPQHIGSVVLMKCRRCWGTTRRLK